jgi:hypothetical protein
MRQVQSPVLAAVLVLAIAWPSARDAGAQTTPPPAEPPRFEPLPVPAWIAWKVLYESLSFYRSHSPVAVATMLHERTGLAPADVPALFDAGEAYLLTVARLEDEARRRIQAQYGRKPFGPPTDDSATPDTGPPRLLIERGTPIFDLVRESGLYDAIEGAKHAALATHLEALTAALGAPAVAGLTQLVETTVTPAISRGVITPPARLDDGSGHPR